MRVRKTAKIGVAMVFLGVIAFGWSVARVQAQPTPEEKRKAVKHYQTAEQAMAKKLYSIAAREYAEAYQIMKDPVLFYKIAGANMSAGDCRTALVYFGRYLREGKPSPSFKKITEQKIAECKAKTGTAGTGTADTGTGTAGTGTGTAGTGTGTAGTGTGTGTTGTGTTGTTGTGTTGTGTTGTGTGTTGTGTTGTGTTGTGTTGTGTGADLGTGAGAGGAPPSFSDEQRSWKHSAAWVSVGIAVALLSTGAVLGMSASSREEDIKNLYADANGTPREFSGTIQERYDELVDEGDRLNNYSRISFIAAGVAAASAVVFFILDATGSKGAKATARRGTLTPIVSQHGLGFAAGWEF